MQTITYRTITIVLLLYYTILYYYYYYRTITYRTNKQVSTVYSTENYIQYPVISIMEKKYFKRMCVLVAQLCLTLLQTHGLQPFRLLSPRNSPGKNTGVGYYSLLQRIFPTQGSNWVSCIADKFFTAWATGKPKNVCIYVCACIKLNHFAIQEKLTQHCKSPIL